MYPRYFPVLLKNGRPGELEASQLTSVPGNTLEHVLLTTMLKPTENKEVIGDSQQLYEG